MEGSEVIPLLSHLSHLLSARSGKIAAWTCPPEMEDPTRFVYLDTPVPETVSGIGRCLHTHHQGVTVSFTAHMDNATGLRFSSTQMDGRVASQMRHFLLPRLPAHREQACSGRCALVGSYGAIPFSAKGQCQ